MPNHTTKLRRTYRPVACFPRFMRKRGRECAKIFGNMSGARGVAFSSAPPEGGFPTRMGLRQAAASPAVSRGMFWIPACVGMPHGAPLSRLAARAILSRQARDGGWIPACVGMPHGDPLSRPAARAILSRQARDGGWIPAWKGMPHGTPLSRLAARAILSRQARDGGWIPACAGMTHGPCSRVHFTPASLSWKGQMRAGFGENALQSLFLGSRDRYDGK